MDKLKPYQEIEQIVKSLKDQNKTIAFTNGCFDIIHAGHVNYLKKARKQADVLIVGLNSDKSVKLIKGDKRPINNELDRASILSAFYFVDYIIIFNEETPVNLIKIIKPDILIKGADWKDKNIIGSDFVVKFGGKVVLIDYEEGKSTTSIIDKILTLYGCS